MKIGIIGDGVVGGACKFGFKLLGHDVSVHDIKYGTTIKSILNTEIVYVCVPTPASPEGSCDTSIVSSVLHSLAKEKYEGIVVIKSTVLPGTTDELRKQTGLNVCFVPEFLRERCAVTDFTENHDVCIIGTTTTEEYKKIKQCHGNLPKKFVQLTPTEAEFCKYFNNVYNASMIVFANSFYEACKLKGVNYSNVKNAIIKRQHIHSHYLECNDNFRGFGGMCLPKDVAAMAQMMKDTPVDFFQMLLNENKNYRVTVYDGMRK